MNKCKKPSTSGKRYSKADIQRAVAEWSAVRQLYSAALDAGPPSMVASLPPPPVQFPDCMQVWMQAFYFAKAIDANNEEIERLRVANGGLLVELIDRTSRLAVCIASHTV